MKKQMRKDKNDNNFPDMENISGKSTRKHPQLPPRARRFCAFLVGVVFFLSGLLKLMDPVGTGLIMD